MVRAGDDLSRIFKGLVVLTGTRRGMLRNVMCGGEAIYEIRKFTEKDRKARTEWALTLI